MSKKNYILLAIFCSLLGGALLYQYLAPRWPSRAVSAIKNPLSGIDLAAADRLEASSGGYKAVYSKNGKGWRLDKSVYSLEPGRIEGLLTDLKLAASSTAEVVATNAAGAEQLGLGSTADKLAIYRQGKKLIELTLGTSSTPGNFYLKTNLGPNSYAIAYALVYDGPDWRQHSIASFEAQDAAMVVLDIGSSSYRYNKAPLGFKAQGQVLAGYNVPQAMAVFSDLEAQGYPKAGQCVPDTAKLTVIVSGKSYGLDLGKNNDAKQANLACVRLPGQTAWYLIGQDQAKMLFGR